MDNLILNHWNDCSDKYFGDAYETFEAVKENPIGNGFPKAMAEVISEYFPDFNFKGKKVLVPSCGDNTAVWAFYFLGADVTACDLSDRQIYNAEKIAKEKNLNIRYYVNDSMELSDIEDETYDLVYTSNGVHVWINNLPKMYGSFNRVLKSGGYYIMFETHPFCRPFDGDLLFGGDLVDKGEFKIVKPYEDVGPFEKDITFAWRIQDFVNSVISSGFTLKRLEEFHSIESDYRNHNYLYRKDNDTADNYDWRKTPYAAIPQCLGWCCQK